MEGSRGAGSPHFGDRGRGSETGNLSQFTVVRENPPAGLLPFYEAQVEKSEAELAHRFEGRSVGRFPGRIEPVEALVYEGSRREP